MIYTIAIILAILTGAYVWNLFEPRYPSSADETLLARRDYYFAAIAQDHRLETWAWNCLEAIAHEFMALHWAEGEYEQTICYRVIMHRMDYDQAMNLLAKHRARVVEQIRTVEDLAPMDGDDMMGEGE